MGTVPIRKTHSPARNILAGLNRRKSGSVWERRAESFLRKQGLKTLSRNYFCRAGEIDLIMKDEECVVFVEVRYRKSDRYGSGAESIGRVKQLRIIRTARYFLHSHRQFGEMPCRFDVISIGSSLGRPHYNWIKHAFEV